MTVILKITAPNRSTGTDKSWYLSPSTEIPVDDSEAGGTGNPTIPVINSVGRIEGAISRTILHEAQGISSSTQGEVSVTLQNDPAGTEGPLDEWDDYVLDDAVVKLYIDGSVVWTGAHRGEPLFSRTTNGGGTVTSVLAKPSGPDIQLMRLAGVPNAVRRLTQSVVKAAGAPSNVAYDVSEFTVFCHYTGELAGRVLNRVNSGSGSPQIQISRISGDRLEIRGNDTSNVTQLLHQQDMPTGRPFHRVSVSISSSAAVVVVDGVATTYSGYAANTGAGGEMRLGGLETTYAADSTAWGWAFLDRAMTESEMKSATLSSLEDEPALVSLWRGDDGAGSAINDSGPLNNDATISGVENTDWEWAPADSGEPEQEGDLVPELFGYGRELPATQIDTNRNRFIFARNPESPVTAVVREGGESIFPSDIESYGVIDLSGTPSKPVTITTTAAQRFYLSVDTLLDDHWPSVSRDEEDIKQATSMSGSRGSIYVDSAGRSVTDVLTESLQGVGSWWDFTKSGNLTAGHLSLPAPQPPTSSSYIQAWIRASAGNSITEGAFTGWMLVRDSGDFPNVTFNLFGLDFDGSPQDLVIALRNSDSWPSDKLTVDWTYQNVSASSGLSDVVARNSWHFFAITIEDDAGDAKVTLRIGPDGGSLSSASHTHAATSATFTGKPYAHAGRLYNFVDMAVYNTVLSVSDIDDLYTQVKAPTDIASLDWHAPLAKGTESGGTWTSEVTTGPGQVDLHRGFSQTIIGQPHEPVNQPEQTYDLRKMPGAQMDLERIPAAHEITMQYDRAFTKLNESDLTGTITDSERLEVLREWETSIARNEVSEGVKNREIRFAAPIRKESFANSRFLARGVADLFQEDSYLSKISGLPREAIDLSCHAEIRVTDADGQDWTIRVLSRATNNVLNADTSGEILGLARKD